MPGLNGRGPAGNRPVGLGRGPCGSGAARGTGRPLGRRFFFNRGGQFWRDDNSSSLSQEVSLLKGAVERIESRLNELQRMK